MEDKRLEQDIEAALSHARGLKDRNINVAVSDDVQLRMHYVEQSWMILKKRKRYTLPIQHIGL